MIIVREAPSIHHEQPEFHMHDGIAKYLKKTTTDLTIGISALISGSDIYHIYITYIQPNTQKNWLDSSIGARLAVSDVQGLLLS